MFANIISVIALVVSIAGLYIGYWIADQIAKRNENKILVENLLSIIKEMNFLAEKFFNQKKHSLLSIRFYSNSFSSKAHIALFLVYLLKNESKILKDDIDKPLSDLHKFATFNIEEINRLSIEERTSTYAEVTSSYLTCVRVIHQAFHAKYHQ